MIGVPDERATQMREERSDCACSVKIDTQHVAT